MNEYLNVIRNNYANFTGRARRREYWMFTLINTIIVTVLSIPVYGAAIGMAMQSDTGAAPSAGLTGTTLIFAVLMGIYALAVMVPSIAVTVRRLHDAGFSGWLYLLNFVGLSIVVLVLCVLDSKPGSNKWGPNPKGVTDGTPAPAQNW
ncbi:DUF805 domain-containing protein [Deinococcus soli (ex Cha et al. 2016)]|uniref:Uncharacterized membrane protein YhaH (DUF805 family) n=2 Tax=Deinococcus soli (ex Cha et al. 2016) TaxID=1309411 RepID=A0ACC6KKC1_9DEIO|nr:DUF805 domain-containing protein [Deinococcus soli (ex Cha et al. 2016)]MDR6220225.1 uncharacterized membrane protein YhaH (DUF805 family) [Deinococcus soli (ex Cha et al. 2016)]MDR6330080.1 uncharacterized membrane protein YhaH (DUF805 family) [Deinococcus soli (ex Cha et al. 2016)]MDR6752968.1 uncharacterized membrane protein YhaH (DUF805 family) [Deinococcus soli (ex Cha et al. 2016)]